MAISARRRLTFTAIAASLVGLVTGFLLGGALLPSVTMLPDSAKVEISDFAFKPATITVPVGTTVIWVNLDSIPHTVTSDAGLSLFGSKNYLSFGDVFSYTFTEAGVFGYYCVPHPYIRGTVIVE